MHGTHPPGHTDLLVCTTCRPAGTPREGAAAGTLLWQAVQAAVHAQGLPLGVRVHGIACLSACGRACTVALQAPAKHTYSFGDLLPGEATAQALLACAAQHHISTDGNLPRSERPEVLRSGILLRLPPSLSQPADSAAPPPSPAAAAATPPPAPTAAAATPPPAPTAAATAPPPAAEWAG